MEINGPPVFPVRRFFGINRQPTRAMNNTPVSANTPPTGEKSNIVNGSPFTSLRKFAIIILGGVPIRVTSPPKMDAKDIGINTLAGDLFAFAEDSIPTGIKRARAPTLLMTVENTAEIPESTATCIETRLMEKTR